MTIRFQVMRWTIWSLAVLFYFYEYFLRVSPSIMTTQLMAEFGVSAGTLGVLSAFYLYGYAPMQLPGGMLMDHFGARQLLTIASAICGLGAILFAITNALWIAEAGRFLTGIGAAFAFVGMVYITSHWFSAKSLALLVGIGNSIGMLGAVGGEGPLATAVKFFGWRGTIWVSGIIGLGLSAVIYLTVRNEPSSSKEERGPKKRLISHLVANIKCVGRNSQSWVNSVIGLFFYASTVAFAGLWSVPFLESAYGMSREAAGYGGSSIYIGWIVGGPIIGHISDRMGQRKPMLLIFTLLALVFLLFLLYAPAISHIAIYSLCFLLGGCLSAQLLCYSLAIELNPLPVKGTALALTNFMVFVGGAIVQTLVGILLDDNWKGTIVDGIPFYSRIDYSFALICFPVTLILAFFLTFFLKEISA